jgi:hypothetical protein
MPNDHKVYQTVKKCTKQSQMALKLRKCTKNVSSKPFKKITKYDFYANKPSGNPVSYMCTKSWTTCLMKFKNNYFLTFKKLEHATDKDGLVVINIVVCWYAYFVVQIKIVYFNNFGSIVSSTSTWSLVHMYNVVFFHVYAILPISMVRQNINLFGT